MLTELHIENLGVIERAVLVLDGGVTALSGETGAGKTMLVEAIGLLVGGRADASMVRSGAGEARIDGRFEVATANGVDEVVLSRVVLAEGRSRAYINGRPATVASLAEVTREMVDMHGQHAHQSFLSVATQRAALDEFGSIDLATLRSTRARLTEIDAELATLGGDERARAREIDLLKFQVDELASAGLTAADEDDRLADDEALLADAVAHREAGAAALAAVRNDDSADPIAAAIQALADRSPFAVTTERLRGLMAEIDDVVAELRSLTESIEEQPERLAEIRERRQLLVDLRRKYGKDLAEVMAFHFDADERLRELQNYDRRAAELDEVRGEAADAERVAARAVGAARRGAAPLLASAVESRLRALAMPNARIGVEIGGSNDDPGDEVRFLLSANPGSPLLPLNRVASGGELARAMLALRLVLADAGGGAASTLVFDEVDAGIGGSAAAAVGTALADLGRHHQVLIVTHLPQVASQATRQLVVAKTTHAGQTFTTVDDVSGDARVSEIARMLSGSETDAAIQHARDMLK